MIVELGVTFTTDTKGVKTYSVLQPVEAESIVGQRQTDGVTQYLVRFEKGPVTIANGTLLLWHTHWLSLYISKSVHTYTYAFSLRFSHSALLFFLYFPSIRLEDEEFDEEWLDWFDVGKALVILYLNSVSRNSETVFEGKPDASVLSESFLTALACEERRKLFDRINSSLHEKSRQSRLNPVDDLGVITFTLHSIRPDVFLQAFEPILDLNSCNIVSLYAKETERHTVQVPFHAVIALAQINGEHPDFFFTITDDGRIFKMCNAESEPLNLKIIRRERQSWSHINCAKCTTFVSLAGMYMYILLLSF